MSARRWQIGDERLTVREIAQRAGLRKNTVFRRLERGIRGVALLSPSLPRNLRRSGRLQ